MLACTALRVLPLLPVPAVETDRSGVSQDFAAAQGQAEASKWEKGERGRHRRLQGQAQGQAQGGGPTLLACVWQQGGNSCWVEVTGGGLAES